MILLQVLAIYFGFISSPRVGHRVFFFWIHSCLHKLRISFSCKHFTSTCLTFFLFSRAPHSVVHSEMLQFSPPCQLSLMQHQKRNCSVNKERLGSVLLSQACKERKELCGRSGLGKNTVQHGELQSVYIWLNAYLSTCRCNACLFRRGNKDTRQRNGNI